MAKIYTKPTKDQSLNPKKKTISFLLNYSTSFAQLNAKDKSFRIHLN